MKKIFFILTATTVVLAFSACKQEKKTEDIIVEKVIEKPHDAPVSMEGMQNHGTVKWIGGATYTYTIERSSIDSLGLVENNGVKYHDNAIRLTVKRSDGTEFFKKTFTKANFAPALTKQFKDTGILLGMNLDEAEGNELKFVVCIGSPDESNDELYYVLMKLNNFGGTSAEPYSGERGEGGATEEKE